MLKKLTGAEIVVETLIEQGVTDVFGYPGGQVLNIYDAIYRSQDRLNHILTAHEQGASHAADGYSRATGKVGVVISTSGPGATNLVTGIATAMLDSIPLVAITGNVPCSLIGKDSFQEIDITGVTLPITKHNFFVSKTEDLADTIREAFRIARSGRPGPVLIDIPKDVQINTADFEPLPVAEKIPLPKVDIQNSSAADNAEFLNRHYTWTEDQLKQVFGSMFSLDEAKIDFRAVFYTGDAITAYDTTTNKVEDPFVEITDNGANHVHKLSAVVLYNDGTKTLDVMVPQLPYLLKYSDF